jgi:hypothetical protein
MAACPWSFAVARVERSETRDRSRRMARIPDFAALNPGYYTM